LTPGIFYLLALLARQRRDGQRESAQHRDRPELLVTELNRFEAAGWITRARDTVTGGCHVVSLTPAARRICSAPPRSARAEDEIFAGFDDDQREVLRGLLSSSATRSAVRRACRSRRLRSFAGPDAGGR